jgi:hypothetical protein
VSDYRVLGAAGAWRRLEGRVAAAVLHAPKTAGDPAGADRWPAIHERCVVYLERHVVGTRWADHLTLAAAVLAARRMDVQTVTTRLRVLHTVFRELLPALGLTDLAQWDPDRHLPAYLRGDLLPHHSPYRRAIFRSDYSAMAGHLRAWLRSLPPAGQVAYRALVLPPPHPWSIQGLARQDEVRRAGQVARKAEVAALLPRFLDLRAQAHFRFNRLQRLRQAYQAAITAVTRDRAGLPFAFSYEEGGDPARGVPHRERLHFRLWDRRSFVLHHDTAYGKYVVVDARLRRRSFADEHNGVYLELVRSGVARREPT